MGFRNKSYATVFGVEPGKGKFTRVRLSISRKNKVTGEYETDFNGYCMFIGTAHTKAAMLKERDRIVLGDVDVSNRYDKETRREYVDYKVFDFDFAETGVRGGGQQSAPASGNRVESNEVQSDEDGLPF